MYDLLGRGLLLLGLILLGLPATSGRQEVGQAHGSRPDQNTAQKPQVSGSTTPPISDKEIEQGAKYDPDCAKPENHEDADFCQQRRAADGAQKSAYWAQGQFWVSIVASVTLVPTLLLSAVGTFMSVAATRQAKKANRISQAGYIADHRPWVKVVGIELTNTEPPLEGSLSVSFDIVMENVGNSPATKVDARAMAFLVDGERGADNFQEWRNFFRTVVPQRPGEDLIGITIFPNDRATMNYTFPFDLSGIRVDNKNINLVTAKRASWATIEVV